MKSKEYLNREDKTCFFCHKTHARRFRVWTHNHQRKHWCCSICLFERGGSKVVQGLLEKIPLQQKQLNFFKKKMRIDLEGEAFIVRPSFSPPVEQTTFLIKTQVKETKTNFEGHPNELGDDK